MSNAWQDLLGKMKQLPTWLWSQSFTKIEGLDQDSEGALRYANTPVDPGEANLMCSRIVPDTEDAGRVASGDPWRIHIDYNEHPMRLLLDIDMPVYVRETSPGKFHVAIDKVITREQHDNIIRTLAVAGIVQNGWADSATGSDLGACLRPPWVSKQDTEDAIAAHFARREAF